MSLLNLSLAGLAAIALQLPAPPPPVAGPIHSSVHDQQDGSRSLDLRLGETVTFTFEGWKPVLASVAAADPTVIQARMPQSLDLTLPETRTPYGVVAKPGEADPHPLNYAAPGTVTMTLVPYQSGTLLLVENGLDRPFRYHAATLTALPDGRMGGRSTTLCPAKPTIGTVESWGARFQALLVIRFEEADPADLSCRM